MVKSTSAVRARRTVVLLLAILTLLLAGASTASEHRTVSRHKVYWLDENRAPDEEVRGARAKVIREDEGLSILVKTRHLVPGSATAWLFFYTCDPADETCGPTNGGMFATADIVRKGGKATFAVGVPVASPHLTDPRTDEVHMILVDGKPKTSPMLTRLTSPAGGTFRQVVIAPPKDP